MEEGSKRRGRPVRGVGRTERFNLKMTKNQRERLRRTAEMAGKSQTDVLLKALEICESMAKTGMSLDLDDDK